MLTLSLGNRITGHAVFSPLADFTRVNGIRVILAFAKQSVKSALNTASSVNFVMKVKDKSLKKNLPLLGVWNEKMIWMK